MDLADDVQMTATHDSQTDYDIFAIRFAISTEVLTEKRKPPGRNELGMNGDVTGLFGRNMFRGARAAIQDKSSCNVQRVILRDASRAAQAQQRNATMKLMEYEVLDARCHGARAPLLSFRLLYQCNIARKQIGNPSALYNGRSRLMAGAEAVTSSLSFLHTPAPLFPTFALPAKSPRRRRRIHIATGRAIRSCAAVVVSPGAEEELFIRRHASTSKTSPGGGAKVLPGANTNDAEEQFDFVRDVDSPSSPPISQPPSDVVEGAPSLKVDSGRAVPSTSAESKQQSSSQRSASDGASNPTRQSGEKDVSGQREVRVLVPREMRGLAEQVRRETSRLFTESRILPGVRMPTRRAAVLFAWDVALILSVLLLLRAGVSRVLRWIHNRLNATRGLRSNIPYEQSVFECMQRPLEFLSLFTVGTALAEVVSRPLAATGLLRNIRTLRELGMIISATWFLLRWIDRIRSRFAGDKRIDKAQVDATSRIATVVTFVASLLISLDTIGINVQTVLAFGGIGGVAIGFAGREIISNFFGGFMIYVTRPFSVGEWIRSIEERELNGTVEDIGWYLTRVRTWDKRPLYIPNSRFSTLIVENGSRMDNRRILHTIHVRHEDMPVVPSIIRAMEDMLMNHHELDPKQHRLAYVDSFGDYSVKLWLSCYTKSVFLYDFRRVQQDILVKCYDIIRANGAKLATINTRDVRPGSDTDRYGPLGRNATFGQSVENASASEPVSTRAYVNTDVPGSPEYGKTTPLVRFNTIESGVDFSRVGQTTAPTGAPVGASANVTSPAPAAAAAAAADDPAALGSGQDTTSQRSASVAAVAVGAAALAAASKKRGTDDREAGIHPGDSKDSTDGTASRPTEGSSVPTVPQGEMRITAAKPARNIQSAAASSQGSPRAAAGTAKGAVHKPADEASGVHAHHGATGKNEDLSASAKPAVNGQANVPAAGVMKITKARKQPSAADIDARDGTDRPKSREPRRSHSDGLESPIAAPGEQRNTSSQEMKITGTRPQKHTTGGSESGVGNTPSPPRSVPRNMGSEDGSGSATGSPSRGSPLPGDDVSATQRTTATPQAASAPQVSNPQGEMKISKARKPVQISQVGGDDERNGIAQSSNSTGTPQPGSIQNSGPASAEKSSDES